MNYPEWPEGLIGFRQLSAESADRHLAALSGEPAQEHWKAAVKDVTGIPDLARAVHQAVASSPDLPLPLRAQSVVTLGQMELRQRWTDGTFEEGLQHAAASQISDRHRTIVGAVDESSGLALVELNRLTPMVFAPIFSLAAHYSTGNFQRLLENQADIYPRTRGLETSRYYKHNWKLLVESMIRDDEIGEEKIAIASHAAKIAVFNSCTNTAGV